MGTMATKNLEPLKQITRRFFAYQSLFLVVILLFVVSLATYWGFQKQIDGQIYADRLLSERVGDYVQNAFDDLKTLNYMPIANDSLKAIGQSKKYFDVLYFIDAEGHLAGIYPEDPKFPIGRDMSATTYFTESKQDLTVSDPFISINTGNPTVFISIPAQQNGGVIVGELSLYGLQEFLAQSEIQPIGEFYITDHNGYFLANPQYNLVKERVDIRNSGIIQKAQTGRQVQLNYIAHTFVINVVEQNPYTGYYSIIQAPVLTMFGEFLIPSILGVFLFAVMIYLMYKRYQYVFSKQVITPLLKLQKNAENLAKGDFSHPVQPESNAAGFQEMTSLTESFNLMKQAIQAREAALGQEKNLLLTLINNLPDAIFVKDLTGKRTLSNPADYKMCGLPGESEILGKTVEDFFPPALAAQFREDDLKVLRDGKLLLDREVKEVKESGEVIWTSASKIPLKDEQGNTIGLIGINRDITKQKQAELEIQQLNADLEQKVIERTRELENVNRELEAFSYSVSHDLKAPLRAIDGYTYFILDDYADKLDETGRDYFEHIRSASHHMGELIEDLLRLSRISRSPLMLGEVDLACLAHESIDTLRESDPARDVGFVCPERLVVAADARLMRIALDNLIRNSWKFSQKTENAMIELGSYAAEDGKTVYFVKDNGAGFDMAYADKLFGAFQRFHARSEYEGTGIGLAIVKRVINRHGGEIWAESKVNEGTTFFFTLQA